MAGLTITGTVRNFPQLGNGRKESDRRVDKYYVLIDCEDIDDKYLTKVDVYQEGFNGNQKHVGTKEIKPGQYCVWLSDDEQYYGINPKMRVTVDCDVVALSIPYFDRKKGQVDYSPISKLILVANGNLKKAKESKAAAAAQ